MTFREKLALERPERISECYIGGCYGCPSDYGYEANKPCGLCHVSEDACSTCWDREMPVAPEEEEVPTALHETPQAVRKLVEARIESLTEEIKVLSEQIRAREDERDTLCDYLRSENNAWIRRTKDG